MQSLHILIIDDEKTQLQSLKSFLSRRKHIVYTASGGPEGMNVIENQPIDAVLTDYRMPEWSGQKVLETVKKFNPLIDVVIMTAYGTIENAVDLMKAGAYDFLNKPIDLGYLENLLERLQKKRVLEQENRILKEQLQKKFTVDSIISQSAEMEQVLNLVSRVARSNASVLIRGESGTGKELIAKAIHYNSNRKDKPFITVNMAALSDNLVESELFGHEKGAFTGASHQRSGRFQEANGGTLFIDEVGDIPLNIQVKLLRAIQFGQFEKLGSSTTQKTDVRIIAATHQNLEEKIKNKTFREDLYYRLNVVTIPVPPLRKRKTDILPLLDRFVQKFAAENQKAIKGFSKEARDAIMKHDFPGNIRELENMVERAVIMSRDEYIRTEDLPAHFQITEPSANPLLDPFNLDDTYTAKMASFEQIMIRQALDHSGNNQSAAARLLEMTERHLRSRMEKLNMKKENRD